VLTSLRTLFGAGDADIANWFRHWVNQTFEPLEALLADSPNTGRFCHGDSPGLADLCLVPQVVNNRRYQLDMAPYPTISRIAEACLALPPFRRAAPESQPDAE